ncbi:hypothetical protein AVEN_78203-1 [Araneus ventricosus]|uniref:Transposable element Tc3 transposase n=1 Tax=Araneus ventricosus TaxID=182803 RepID=A0A4Y2R640_ARAVE|nr:hypothetical protein AVEN_78203-1 [Araneus ventricosus]
MKRLFAEVNTLQLHFKAFYVVYEFYCDLPHAKPLRVQFQCLVEQNWQMKQLFYLKFRIDHIPLLRQGNLNGFMIDIPRPHEGYRLPRNARNPFTAICTENWWSKLDFPAGQRPIHVAKSSWEWFLDNGVHVIEWTVLSPDLNPQENVWGVLSRAVYVNADSFSLCQN